jgi:hypothetical protein
MMHPWEVYILFFFLEKTAISLQAGTGHKNEQYDTEGGGL